MSHSKRPLQLARAASIAASICILSSASAGSYDRADEPIPNKVKPFAQFLADVADRSRRVIYTVHPVSAELGVVRGFVHTSTGTAVLARADLVIDASLPIVVRRAYHSGRETSEDFGRSGWHLTMAERIEQRGDGRLEYIYGNGATLELDRKGRIRSELQAYLTDVIDARLLDGAAIEVVTRNGHTKRFARAGDAYRLVSVVDGYGNRLDVRYSRQGALQRVDSSSGAWVAFARDSQQRIRAVLDNHGRTIRYHYDAHSRLVSMTDPGEHTWQYGYDAANRLLTTTTPNGYVDVEFQYDGAGRVAASRANGVRTVFEYAGSRTVASDANGLATTYVSASSGVTSEITNPLGTKTSIQIGRLGVPAALIRNGVRLADFEVRNFSRARETTVRFVNAGNGEPYLLRFDAVGRIVSVASQTRGDLYRVERYGPALVPESVVHSDGNREEAVFGAGGELTRLVSRDGSALTFSREGALWRISEDSGRQIKLQFNSVGRLLSADTPEGYTLRFGYNDIGLRESTEASYGAIVRYQYDASGSLFFSQSGYATAEQIPAHTYTFGVDHRVDAVTGSAGDQHDYVYGPTGLLTALRSSVLTKDVTFQYDEFARLARVEFEGKTIKHYYAPGEVDVAARAAVRTLPVFNQQREITEFPSRFDAGLTRIRAAGFGLLTYDDTRHELMLAANPTRWDPMAPLTRSIAASRVEGLLRDKMPGLQAFTIPSNRLFVPREYESVNCCICMCPEPAHCDPL